MFVVVVVVCFLCVVADSEAATLSCNLPQLQKADKLQKICHSRDMLLPVSCCCKCQTATATTTTTSTSWNGLSHNNSDAAATHCHILLLFVAGQTFCCFVVGFVSLFFFFWLWHVPCSASSGCLHCICMPHQQQVEVCACLWCLLHCTWALPTSLSLLLPSPVAINECQNE